MTFSEWTPADAAACIAEPVATDDKYSRGVLGVVTGSMDYPGAAVLGVEAALSTGVGMLRYLGPDRPTALVLQRGPEVVTVAGPAASAWRLCRPPRGHQRVGVWRQSSGVDGAR